MKKIIEIMMEHLWVEKNQIFNVEENKCHNSPFGRKNRVINLITEI
jgi:hypothetical protein